MDAFSLLLAGCGKMGGALLERWEALKLCGRIEVIEPSRPDCHPSPATLPVDFKPDVIVFAVKPQILPDMIKDYAHFAQAGALSVSIAAGAPVSFFEAHLGAGVRIVRAMPNTPAAIGKGMTAAFANGACGEKERERAEALLSAAGKFTWVGNEGLLNAVTALSGSGPAYVFLLIEMLEKAGAKLGLPPDMAAELARQTVIGSAALAEATPDLPAAQLRANVTSPGGTTAAALSVLMQPEVQEIFDRALAAAKRRGEELAG